MFVDGNGDGVRSADIEARIDRAVDAPILLSRLFPGAAVDAAEEAVPGGPVHVGASKLMSFTANGTATPGSVYVRGRDGTQWVVRVLGTTARTRVLQYSPATRTWVPAS